MLRATAQERARGALSPGTLAAVRAEFLASGFVTLDGVMEPEALAALRPWCDLHAAQQLAVKLHESPEAGGGLSGAGGFPRSAPWVDSRVVANPLIEHVVSAVLGEGAFMSFCNVRPFPAPLPLGLRLHAARRGIATPTRPAPPSPRPRSRTTMQASTTTVRGLSGRSRLRKPPGWRAGRSKARRWLSTGG